MLKKTITYIDYNGLERTEDFYFNLSRAELVMMETSVAGGMMQRLEKIAKTQDAVAVMEVFRDIIHRAYGEKSDDGKRFVKSDELSTAFEQTEAYSELIMEMINDPLNVAATFIRDIMPGDLAAELQKSMDSGKIPQIGSPET